eukprot:gene29899-37030_t
MTRGELEAHITSPARLTQLVLKQAALISTLTAKLDDVVHKLASSKQQNAAHKATVADIQATHRAEFSVYKEFCEQRYELDKVNSEIEDLKHCEDVDEEEEEGGGSGNDDDDQREERESDEEQNQSDEQNNESPTDEDADDISRPVLEAGADQSVWIPMGTSVEFLDASGTWIRGRCLRETVDDFEMIRSADCGLDLLLGRVDDDPSEEFRRYIKLFTEVHLLSLKSSDGLTVKCSDLLSRLNEGLHEGDVMHFSQEEVEKEVPKLQHNKVKLI